MSHSVTTTIYDHIAGAHAGVVKTDDGKVWFQITNLKEVPTGEGSYWTRENFGKLLSPEALLRLGEAFKELGAGHATKEFSRWQRLCLWLGGLS